MSSPSGPRDDATLKRPRSGGDTPRSNPLISRGGKLDVEALRRAVHQSPSAPTGGSSETQDDAGPVLADATDAQTDAATRAADDDAPNRVVFVLQRDLQTRLDKYLASRIGFMSRSQLQRLIDEGGVTVNGRRPKSSTNLRINDRVEVFVPPPPATDIVPEPIPLDVLFEDEHIIVLNKAPDIIVHPARSHLSGTLINALAWHFGNVSSGALSAVGKEFARPGVVHRLDRGTSGLIVFAKNDEAHWKLARQFEVRTVDKRYLALVHGIMQPAIDTIDLPLGPHPSREKGYREKYVVRHDQLGKAALTVYRVRETYPAPEGLSAARRDGSPSDPGRGFTLVELELKTGRTHQIRVHLSHLGYPIVGDDMYGGTAALTPAMLASGSDGSQALLARQALHATTLTFAHPVSGQRMYFLAPLRADMASAVSTLRSWGPAERGNAPPPPGATVDLAMLLPSSDTRSTDRPLLGKPPAGEHSP